MPRSAAQRRRLWLALGAFVALFSGLLLRAAPALVPEYSVGQTARVDVIAPFPLVVVDREKTAELKTKEAQKVPPVFWVQTNGGPVPAAQDFRSALASEHVRFLSALLAKFRKASIEARSASGNTFREFYAAFTNDKPGTLVTLPLAKLWATNGDEAALIGVVEERLRSWPVAYIRPDVVPAECDTGYQIRGVICDSSNEVTVAAAEKSKVSLRRGEVMPLTRAKSDFLKSLTQEQKGVARAFVSALSPNCWPVEGTTRDWRAKKVQDVWSVTRFEPGEVIVRAGAPVTPVVKAALDEMRVRLLAAESQRPRLPWPVIEGSVAAAGVVGALMYWSVRRRRAAALSLALTEPALENADPVIRAQVAERLARVLGHALVQRLFADRKHLLEAQTQTEVETRQIEERIASIHSQVEERYRAYEEKIARLETELAAAAEENRDLIRAKIVLAKNELEAERARNRIEFN